MQNTNDTCEFSGLKGNNNLLACLVFVVLCVCVCILISYFFFFLIFLFGVFMATIFSFAIFV